MVFMVNLPYHIEMVEFTKESPDWRQTHFGRLLGQALRRFDERVFYLMAHDVEVPLALSNLAAREQIGAAIIHITRHLPMEGARLVDLARSAGMTKQAMGSSVNQCEAWGLVVRVADGRDSRAKQIKFTLTGLAWLNAFKSAIATVQSELSDEVGHEVATVIRLGLEIYASEENKS